MDDVWNKHHDPADWVQHPKSQTWGVRPPFSPACVNPDRAIELLNRQLIMEGASPSVGPMHSVPARANPSGYKYAIVVAPTGSAGQFYIVWRRIGSCEINGIISSIDFGTHPSGAAPERFYPSEPGLVVHRGLARTFDYRTTKGVVENYVSLWKAGQRTAPSKLVYTAHMDQKPQYTTVTAEPVVFGQTNNPNSDTMNSAPKGNGKMSNREMLNLLHIHQGNGKIIRGRYLESSTGRPDHMAESYDFLNAVGADLKEKDMVVVETHGSIAIIQVDDPDVMPTEVKCEIEQLKHVVCKVDREGYDAMKSAESEATRKLALAEVADKLTRYTNSLGKDTMAEVAGMLTSDTAEDAVLEEPASVGT